MKGKFSMGKLLGKIGKGADVVSTGKTVAVITFSIMLVLFANILFQMNLTINAEAKKGLDPALPYMHSIAMHEVNGKPFMYYLSEAVRTGSPIVNDNGKMVNVTRELEVFYERFTLYNSTNGIVLATGPLASDEADSEALIRGGEREGRNVAYYAVPPGGLLKMEYWWLR